MLQSFNFACASVCVRFTYYAAILLDPLLAINAKNIFAVTVLISISFITKKQH